MGDDVARRLGERLDAVELRVQLLEADQTHGERDHRSPSADGNVKALGDLAASKGQSGSADPPPHSPVSLSPGH
jgi:hypothetical protein